MVRFRLKTDYLTYARDQIRGGLWYRPVWWDAVHKCPPTSFIPRVKKRDIPHITFAEDRLISEFAARHPSLKRFDDRAVASHRARTTLASQFVDKQLSLMRTNMSAEASHRAAMAWLIENGPRVLRRVDPGVAAAGSVKPGAVVPEDVFSRVMAKQVDILKDALAPGRRGGDSLLGLPTYRDFRTAAERAALERRGPAGGAGAGLAAHRAAAAALRPSGTGVVAGAGRVRGEGEGEGVAWDSSGSELSIATEDAAAPDAVVGAGAEASTTTGAVKAEAVGRGGGGNRAGAGASAPKPADTQLK